MNLGYSRKFKYLLAFSNVKFVDVNGESLRAVDLHPVHPVGRRLQSRQGPDITCAFLDLPARSSEGRSEGRAAVDRAFGRKQCRILCSGGPRLKPDDGEGTADRSILVYGVQVRAPYAGRSRGHFDSERPETLLDPLGVEHRLRGGTGLEQGEQHDAGQGSCAPAGLPLERFPVLAHPSRIIRKPARRASVLNRGYSMSHRMLSLMNLPVAAVVLAASVAMADDRDWVEKSNAYAGRVLEELARYNPESAGGIGVEGVDGRIVDLRSGLYERVIASSEAVLEELEAGLARESDLRVRQDLEILIRAVQDGMETARLERENMLPYFNLNQTVFGGVRALIDPQIARERYPAAVARMKKYAGLEDGGTPITELARARTEERFDVADLVGPYRGEVQQDLERADTLIEGIEELLAGTDLEGWEPVYETLAGQLRDYNDWVRAAVLPRARDDFRLPPVMYANALKNWGVDATPEQLIETATKGYMDIRNEMEALAPLIAKEKGYKSDDYREVIALLKRDGAIDGDKLLDHYYDVLRELEVIIKRENLLTLPDRDAGIRVATAAETVVQPAAHLDPPRLIGNTGEYPIFVLPQLTQNADGSWVQTDDTYVAGSWTLTAHEARPGHELQFSSIIEEGVSIARAVFAFNSANVEGWGLYAEAIVRPYLPLEAQMISLQYRLMRAGRMFLDPMLNLGMISPEEAKQLIVDDMAIGESWAQNEVERYTYRMPGQATAYYYGYSKMQTLRLLTELKLQDRFDQRAFHDFVLEQGLLPPDILREALLEEFVPSVPD